MASEVRWSSPAGPRRPLQPWDGSLQPAPALEPLPGIAAEAAPRLAAEKAAFMAHRRALPELRAAAVNHCPHLWVSGTESWFALAARGAWVEGCAESLGFGALRAMLASPLLALPPLSEWLALTNQEAAAGWAEGPVLATYRHVSDSGGGRGRRSPRRPPRRRRRWGVRPGAGAEGAR